MHSRTIRRFFLVVSMAVLLAASSALPGKADTIYSNLGEGGTFDTGNGWLVGGSMQVIAHQFIPAADFTFTDAQLALGVISGGLNTVNVYLMTDSDGLPGDILELMIATDISPFPGDLATVTSKVQPTLGAGTPYWIVASAPGANEEWNFNSTGVFSTDTNFVFNLMDSPTGPWLPVPAGDALSAYQVNGDPAGKGANFKPSKPSPTLPLKTPDLEKR